MNTNQIPCFQQELEGPYQIYKQDEAVNTNYLDEDYDYDTSNSENDYFLMEDFHVLKDLVRCKKFYLKEAFDQEMLSKLEDAFIEKSTEEDTGSEEEKIKHVIWSEEYDPVQNKLVKLVEGIESKKSNSKFTLSLLDEERVTTDMDSCEGEEIRGRFLEVKDSLEVLATSSRNLHGNKFSDWDISTEDDYKVNRIWRKNDSTWTSSPQIEIEKFPLNDEEATSHYSEDDLAARNGATEPIENMLDTFDGELECGPTKKVLFCSVSNSCQPKEKSLSQTSIQSGKSAQKKVSFHKEYIEGESFNEIIDKTYKKVSFCELTTDDNAEVGSASSSRIKKSVSFHDSVEFEKENMFIEGSFGDDNEIDSQLNNTSKGFGANKSEVSELSLIDSISTHSNYTILDDSVGGGLECQDLSDLSVGCITNQVRIIQTYDCRDIDLYTKNVMYCDSGYAMLSNVSKETDDLSDYKETSLGTLRNEETEILNHSRVENNMGLIENLIQENSEDEPITNSEEDNQNQLKRTIMQDSHEVGTTLKLHCESCQDTQTHNHPTHNKLKLLYSDFVLCQSNINRNVSDNYNINEIRYHLSTPQNNNSLNDETVSSDNIRLGEEFQSANSESERIHEFHLENSLPRLNNSDINQDLQSATRLTGRDDTDTRTTEPET